MGKRQRTGAVQDADALSRGPRPRASAVECASPLALCVAVQGFHARIISANSNSHPGLSSTEEERESLRAVDGSWWQCAQKIRRVLTLFRRQWKRSRYSARGEEGSRVRGRSSGCCKKLMLRFIAVPLWPALCDFGVRALRKREGKRRLPSPALPGAGSMGLQRSRARLSAFVQPSYNDCCRVEQVGSPDRWERKWKAP